jgi:hypothetical protein
VNQEAKEDIERLQRELARIEDEKLDALLSDVAAILSIHHEALAAKQSTPVRKKRRPSRK